MKNRGKKKNDMRLAARRADYAESMKGSAGSLPNGTFTEPGSQNPHKTHGKNPNKKARRR